MNLDTIFQKKSSVDFFHCSHMTVFYNSERNPVHFKRIKTTLTYHFIIIDFFYIAISLHFNF